MSDRRPYRRVDCPICGTETVARLSGSGTYWRLKAHLDDGRPCPSTDLPVDLPRGGLAKRVHELAGLLNLYGERADWLAAVLGVSAHGRPRLLALLSEMSSSDDDFDTPPWAVAEAATAIAISSSARQLWCPHCRPDRYDSEAIVVPSVGKLSCPQCWRADLARFEPPLVTCDVCGERSSELATVRSPIGRLTALLLVCPSCLPWFTADHAA